MVEKNKVIRATGEGKLLNSVYTCIISFSVLNRSMFHPVSFFPQIFNTSSPSPLPADDLASYSPEKTGSDRTSWAPLTTATHSPVSRPTHSAFLPIVTEVLSKSNSLFITRSHCLLFIQSFLCIDSLLPVFSARTYSP